MFQCPEFERIVGSLKKHYRDRSGEPPQNVLGGIAFYERSYYFLVSVK